jgi:hypothetical protein
MNQKNQPVFPGVTAPSIDFESVRDQRRSMLLYYDVDLSVAHSFSAATPLVLPLIGNAFYVDADLTNIGNAVVRFQDSVNAGSAPVYVSAGFIAKVPFTQVIIENVAQAGKRLRIFYGVDVDFTPGQTSQTAITGTVSVVDGGLARTLLNQAFLGYQAVGPVAAQYPIAQLFNPVASGKNLYVEQITASSALTGALRVSTYGTSLGGGAAGISKYFGAAVGVGLVQQTNNAAALFTSTFGYFSLSANAIFNYKFTEPIILVPGKGLILNQEVVNTGLNASFEWFEQ